MIDWAEVLRDLRAERGISQRELSKLSGVSRSTVRRIEVGICAPDLPTFERVLGALGYEVDIFPQRRPLETSSKQDHHHGEVQSGRSAFH